MRAGIHPEDRGVVTCDAARPGRTDPWPSPSDARPGAQWKATPGPSTWVVADGKPVLVPQRLRTAAERGMLR